MTLSKSQASLINRHVLIVEDEYLIADDIAQVLEQAGAAVVGPAPTRATALALLTSERIDIAVLDIELHGKLVFPVANYLRARAIPFVFATGYSQTSLPAEYRDVATWEKPFDAYALALALANLTGDAGSGPALGDPDAPFQTIPIGPARQGPWPCPAFPLTPPNPLASALGR
ncbi:response regulator [Microvirga lotononidis]|uniref:CheY-like receiver domain-containing protein n=1 Tax=Microvirga lotononidis TaxID=864069 RepID=I4YMY3_9HYPH|nr:response regulator [Microvirga lotononidis]EIM25325.1 CheY-like receiver domain-containing protein [Microvirga lotononidis]WQO27372.1 response regulator [Microvirga lotononidis]